ncbi:hypothetical protein KNU71_gp128 [Streptomyces phage Braelyn]|uniref:DUF7336 domain-containing protein n=1 Tax=Streptomyces phage Braelyn TaxID=2593356 RepID=A0A514U240_9CAUD|nr:hypothetical protein KNU71_gp128 [Streptomyces phage Braelyn]QDK02989.1 hypothetical protein SEA_BRAELYN_157 [Streptomyces phage Braelyn]
MKVYIVIEDICCCGIEILGVFSTEKKAQDFIDSDEKYKHAEITEEEVA